MLINTAIVEDDADQSSLLQEYLLAISQEKYQFHVDIYHSAEEFLSSFSSGKYHLLFQDIQLKRLDGLTCSKRVREQDSEIIIVFITSMPQFAINGYEVDAKDYILKPLIFDSFSKKMDRILPMIKENRSSLITITSYSEGTRIINADDIIFAEVFGHKLIYHTVSEDIEIKGKISEAEQELKPFGFIRCSRNAVLNPKFIEIIHGNTVRMKDYELVISAPRKQEFLKELNIWLLKGK